VKALPSGDTFALEKPLYVTSQSYIARRDAVEIAQHAKISDLELKLEDARSAKK